MTEIGLIKFNVSTDTKRLRRAIEEATTALDNLEKAVKRINETDIKVNIQPKTVETASLDAAGNRRTIEK